jgi:hypothetical protein
MSRPCGVCDINPARLNEAVTPANTPLAAMVFLPVRNAWTVRYIVDNTFQTPGGYTQNMVLRLPFQKFKTSYSVTHDLNGTTELTTGTAVRIFQRTQTTLWGAGAVPAIATHIHTLRTVINGIENEDGVLVEVNGQLDPIAPNGFNVRELVDTTTQIGNCEDFSGKATVFGSFEIDRTGLGAAPNVGGLGAARRLNCELTTSD